MPKTPAVLIATALLLAVPARADAPSPAESLYLAAVKATSSRPQPAFESSTLRSQDDGLSVKLFVRNHFVWLGIGRGNGPSLWQLRHRTDDYATEIIDEDGKRYVTGRSFFDPTWYGTYRALRDGMLNYQDVEKPVSETATPVPQQASSLREIAAIHVMGPTIYALEDRGPQNCPNGSPAHALHTVAHDRAPEHQLSDVIVNLQTHEFCMMRFGVRDAFGFHGLVEQHFADVGGYWTLTDGLIDGNIRFFGISMHHGVWHFTRENISYPRTIPAEAFVVPLSQ